mmetsp:Transcript_18576/g.53087  ORF Transcript_18576/g.53087 Transcript_18576/m.53087 type:complete len:260 (-) Transcript_18576:1375-2154(-)
MMSCVRGLCVLLAACAALLAWFGEAAPALKGGTDSEGKDKLKPLAIPDACVSAGVTCPTDTEVESGPFNSQQTVRRGNCRVFDDARLNGGLRVLGTDSIAIILNSVVSNSIEADNGAGRICIVDTSVSGSVLFKEGGELVVSGGILGTISIEGGDGSVTIGDGSIIKDVELKGPAEIPLLISDTTGPVDGGTTTGFTLKIELIAGEKTITSSTVDGVEIKEGLETSALRSREGPKASISWLTISTEVSQWKELTPVLLP